MTSLFDTVQVYYINMDCRPDRREAILKEFARVGFTDDQITRVHATSYKGCPNSGCMSSHAAALRIADKLYEEGENLYPYALIVEDDLQFIEDVSKIHSDISYFLTANKNNSWQAILLTTFNANIIWRDMNSVFSQIEHSSNAAAYLIHRDAMLPLARLFEDNLENLYTTQMHWIYANDQLWCSMMKTGNWYMFNRYLGFQKGDYSDLSGECKGPIIPKIITHE